MRAAALLIAVLVSLAVSAKAAPPEPPVPTPPELERLYDGYDLRTLYQEWRYWIEAQKGAVTKAMLAEPDAFSGESPFGAPLIRYGAYGDMGHFVSGDLRTYCPPIKPYGYDRQACHYVLREARVPVNVGYGEDPPTVWMRRAFEPARFATYLKAQGLPPNTVWWRVDREKLFASHASAAEVLRAAGRINRVDSRTCPALAAAIRDMETRRLVAPVDFWTVGPETQLTPPSPHGVIWRYELNLVVDGQIATVESTGKWMTDVVGPVFDAARSCGFGDWR